MSFYFHSVASFLVMGGYALYVWSAYLIGISALLIFAFSGRKRE